MIQQNKKYTKSVLDFFSILNFYIRKGWPHGHRYGKKKGCKEYHTAKQLQKCRKKKYDNIHDRFIRDKFYRKTMIELSRSEEIILEMDRLASEDHSHVATDEEIDVYRGNWIRFELSGFRHDADKASTWLQESAVDLASPQESGGQSVLWKLVAKFVLMVAMWHPSSETSPQRWTWHWSNWETCDNQWIVYGAKFTVIISVTVNAVHCHRRGL